MTEKVQKIREEVKRMHNLLPVMDGDNISVNYADRTCTTLEMYIDSLQEEPVSEDKMTISKEWFEHCKKSWYNEGYIDGEYNRDRQFEKPVSDDLGEFINELSKQFPEVSFAKVCKIATRTAKWQKQQMMKDTIEGNVLANGMGEPVLHLWDKGKHLVGKKVKVVVIEED